MEEPHFGELYVVSDLHIGDVEGQPIFDQGPALSVLIGHLTKRAAPSGGPVGLVLNGDVFDTLPEKMKGYVCEPGHAESVISKIMSSPSFSCVFDALRGYVAQPEHQLIFVLGNHDLELIYPNVQELLRRELAAPKPSEPGEVPLGAAEREARRARVTFATVGTGFRCRVGSSAEAAVSVACVHGNEFDDWNAFDPETLTRLARAVTLGHASALTSVAPNSGTRLVRDVMNGVKAQYPFVDLLKPEQEGVFTILLAIAPNEVKRVPDFLKSLAGSATVGASRVSRVLGGSAIAGAPVAPTVIEDERGKWQPTGKFADFLNKAPPSTALETAWQQTRAGNVYPEELAAADELLGAGRLALNLLDYFVRRVVQDPMEALRAALADWGGSPETWDLDGQCEVFDELAKLLPDADVLVAGHTHLRRQKHLPASGQAGRAPLYLNTGTWIRLIRLDPQQLLPAVFAPLASALKSKSMAEIDKLPASTLLRQRTVAVIRPSSDPLRVEAALCELTANADAPEKGTLKPVGNFETVQRG
jgi:UDP-2,3-diacylglucosamine pyrophosphatase LpxH